MRLFTLLLAFFLLSISLEAAQTVYGKVQSKDEKAPLPGASVRVVDSQKGTYANSRGVFKLQIDAKDKELLIKSIGYKSKKVSVNSLTDTLLILLEADRVVSGTALVYGEIEPYTLIERAIARKKSNSAKIKTVEGKLQTKVYADAGESLLPGGGDNSISVTMEIGGEEKKEAPKKILMESIAINYKDYDKDIYHSHIISRRQTKNVPAQVNMFVMGEFINFYDERIELMETKIISPMADDAQDYYSYKIIERQILDGKYIYIVEVIPNSTLYPTFDGKIMISEGDYDFVGAELTTSPHTAISFVKSLKFTEKFEKYDHNLWYPNFLEIKSALGADIIKGSFSIDLELTLTSIYSDLKLNEKLPDSLYTEQVKWVTVSSLADSTDKDYWQNNSLFADSKEDEKIYAEVDSLVVNVDSLQQEEDFSFGFTPYLDFNRASDVMYGLTPNIGYKDWYLSYKGAYSTGTDQYYSSLYLNGLFDVSSVQFSANVGYHQEIAVFSDDNTSPRELNTLQAGLFGKDYYDYYQADVFRASIGMQYKELNLGLSFEQSDQQAIGVNTSKYAFGDINWRANPTIDNQKYQTLKYNLLFGSKGFLGIGETPFYLSLYGLFGIFNSTCRR
jgi:hypothetical protein